MDMRCCKPAFLSSVGKHGRQTPLSLGSELVDHADKTFEYRVDAGIVVRKFAKAPNAMADMVATVSQMFFYVRFVGV